MTSCKKRCPFPPWCCKPRWTRLRHSNRPPKRKDEQKRRTSNVINLDILLMEEILHQMICSLSHHLQGFIHPWWCRISSINSMFLNMSNTWIILELCVYACRNSPTKHLPFKAEIPHIWKIQVFSDSTNFLSRMMHGRSRSLNHNWLKKNNAKKIPWSFHVHQVIIKSEEKAEPSAFTYEGRCQMYFLLNMRIFRCHLSFQGSIISSASAPSLPFGHL